MFKLVFLFYLCFCASVFAQMVTTTDMPLGMDVCYMHTSDDFFKKDWGDYLETRWSNQWDAIEMASNNNIVITMGLISGSMTITNGWGEIQLAMDDGHLMVANHSFSHPVTNINYQQEYITSYETQTNWLTYPAFRTYNGKEYDPFFIQFGGSSADYDIAYSIILSNNCLGFRIPSKTIELPWPPWNVGGMFGSTSVGWGATAQWVRVSMYSTDVLDGSWSNEATYGWNDIHANGGTFHLYTHSWTDSSWVYGSNSAIWSNYFEMVGNHTDVWYTDPGTRLIYRYFEEISPPVITTTNYGGRFEFDITFDAAEMAKYGGTVPLTYLVSNVVHTNMGFGDFQVWKQNGGETNWTQLSAIPTNSVYKNGAEGFRIVESDVYISAGMPQNTNTSTIICKMEKNRISGNGWF